MKLTKALIASTDGCVPNCFHLGNEYFFFECLIIAYFPLDLSKIMILTGSFFTAKYKNMLSSQSCLQY